MKASGIYRIVVRGATMRFYIGQAVNLSTRKRAHLNALRSGTHRNIFLQRSFQKYGEEAISFEVLLVCGISVLSMFEQRVLDSYDPEMICNIRKCCVDSQLGTKRTVGSRDKMGAVHKGHKRALGHRKSKQTKAAIAAGVRAYRTGRPHSAETRAKIKAAIERRNLSLKS